MEVVLIGLMCLFAGIIQSGIGLGYSVIFMAVAPFIVPYDMSLLLNKILGFPMVLFLIIKQYKHINLKMILIPVICGVIFTYIGVQFALSINADIMRLILGILLIIFSVFSVFYQEKIRIKPSIKNQIIFGTLAGFLGGISNMNGPPISIYCVSAAKDSKEYVATLQVFFMVTALTAIISHFLNNNISNDIIPFLLVGFVTSLVGGMIGTKIGGKIKIEKMKPIVFGFIGIMGVIVIISSIKGLIA